MKVKEIRAMNKTDLDSRLVELKKDLMKIKAEVSVSNPKNPGRVKQIKRTIARIITVQNKNQKEADRKA